MLSPLTSKPHNSCLFRTWRPLPYLVALRSLGIQISPGQVPLTPKFLFSFISSLGEMDNWLFTSSLSGWCASVLHEKVLLKNLISFATHLQGLVQCRVLAVLSPLPPLYNFPGLSALSTTPPSTERGSLWFWEGLANAISSRWTRLSSDLYFQVSICLQGIHWLIPFLFICIINAIFSSLSKNLFSVSCRIIASR